MYVCAKYLHMHVVTMDYVSPVSVCTVNIVVLGPVPAELNASMKKSYELSSFNPSRVYWCEVVLRLLGVNIAKVKFATVTLVPLSS